MWRHGAVALHYGLVGGAAPSDTMANTRTLFLLGNRLYLKITSGKHHGEAD
jgi:hypothetical protein